MSEIRDLCTDEIQGVSGRDIYFTTTVVYVPYRRSTVSRSIIWGDLVVLVVAGLWWIWKDDLFIAFGGATVLYRCCSET